MQQHKSTTAVCTRAAAATAAAATAFASLYQKQPVWLDRTMSHLTPCALQQLDQWMIQEAEQQQQQQQQPNKELQLHLQEQQQQHQVVLPDIVTNQITTSSSINDGTSVVLPSHDNKDGNNNDDSKKRGNDDHYLHPNPPPSPPPPHWEIIGKALIRRIVHGQLAKFDSVASPDTLEAALKYHILPNDVQETVHEWNQKHLDTITTTTSTTTIIEPPQTWWDALEFIRQAAGGKDNPTKTTHVSRLWGMILDHPMTSYVPMQCYHCGYVIPDVAASLHSRHEQDNSNSSNMDGTYSSLPMGLTEIDPPSSSEDALQLTITMDDGSTVEIPILQLRSGWFCGRPRSAKIFQLDCPDCQGRRSYWYRSSHPHITLRPKRWGRLCGEQEDLRLSLATYLNLTVRICIPLDWDHVWNELWVPSQPQQQQTMNDEDEKENDSQTATKSTTTGKWYVHEDSARNFAVRLDEGIGTWSGVLSIHPNPDLCQDVTDEYLACVCYDARQANTGILKQPNETWNGRADAVHESKMSHYAQQVHLAQTINPTNLSSSTTTTTRTITTTTQAQTVVGYAIHRSGHRVNITETMQQAARDYGHSPWWQIDG